MKLKTEENYTCWKRANLSTKRAQNEYESSSFEIENEKVSDLMSKNDSDIGSYLRAKKELLKLGMHLKYAKS